MAILNAWQKITRVLPGKPFGNGSDGAYSSSTTPTMVNESCSGNAASTTLLTGGTTLSDGDILVVKQMRGTGIGQWEINKVASGGGTSTIILQEALQYTYTDSGDSQAQAVVIPQYTSVTVESGTWSPTGWAGNTGGILVFAATGTLTTTGAININGTNGATVANTTPATGGGFKGGISKASASTQAYTGEGTAGASVATSSANGSGAGGGYSGDGQASGGGGGNANAGSDGNDQASATVKGVGGTSSGSADLLTMTLGGAGGGAATSGDPDTGSGGNGGGIVIAICRNLNLSGVISANGGDGGAFPAVADNVGGGGGAGGSVLIQCKTATLGTNKITTTLGSGGTGSIYGGDGSVGRIAIHHSGTVTGTTSPTFNDTTDSTLFARQPGAALLMQV